MAGGLTVLLAAMPRVELHAQLDALRQDSRFIFDAASSNLMEVRLGQAAQSKGTNAAVKQFGQQMVTDHTNLQNQLTATISKGGTQFKPGMADDDQKEVERLEKLSGAEFDRQYMTAMVQHHQQDVATFQSQSQSARSAEARQIVTISLPVLQRHLSMATQVASQVGVTGVATTNPTQNPTQNPPVVTQNPTVATPGPVSTQTSTELSADMPFVRMAASSNLMETRLGQLAQSKASNQAVKQFGQRMVTDHNQMQQQLTATANAMGQTFTPTLNSQHQQEVSRLQNLNGAEFDRAYMTAMIRAHQQDVNEFQTRSQSANSTQIRNLASSSLPMLQQHLSLAVQVGNQVGADSTTVVAGPNNPNQPDTSGQDNNGNRGNVRADAEFIRDVGADNTMQIELAELARDRAKNSAVRNYAERELQDHQRLQRQWINMATNNGFPLKSGMGSNHREKVEQLRKANGNNVDKTYMTLMVQQHQDEVSYWQKEGRASRSPQVRRLVNQDLPTLEQHLNEARQIARQVGVDPEKALRNRKDIARERNRARNNNND
jgi:putative membrane protein